MQPYFLDGFIQLQDCWNEKVVSISWEKTSSIFSYNCRPCLLFFPNSVDNNKRDKLQQASRRKRVEEITKFDWSRKLLELTACVGCRVHKSCNNEFRDSNRPVLMASYTLIFDFIYKIHSKMILFRLTRTFKLGSDLEVRVLIHLFKIIEIWQTSRHKHLPFGG